MGVRKTKIPAIPEPTEGNLLEVVLAMKEAMEVGEMRRGDPLDAKVTFRDLKDGRIADIRFDGSQIGSRGMLGGTGSPLPDTSIPGPNSSFLRPPSYDGLVLPGRPLNVRTFAVWDGIQVMWDWPDAKGTNTYWKRAVIWASATPSFDNATIVGYSTTNFFTHTGLGLSSGAEGEIAPGVRYYWVAWEDNYDENKGEVDRSDPNPYFWEDGIRGETAIDPAYALGLLAGQIHEGHLVETLNSRIDLVDYNPDDPDNPFTTSVQERILQASTDASGIYAAIAQTASTAVNSSDGYAAGEYTIRVDANGHVAGFGLSAFSRIGEDGVTRESGSSFIVNVGTFAIGGYVYDVNNPWYNGWRYAYPFIVDVRDGLATVGINGELIVDGSITANMIQAGQIGTQQLNAQEVYADLMEADHIIGGSFATSVDPNFRLEINGEGSENELFPLWFGHGTTGGSGSVFYFEKGGTLKLAGELYVTGAGKFFAGNFGAGEWRLELGGPADEFLLWAGTGTKSKSNENFAFWVDNNGEARFKGKLEAEFVSGEISRTTLIQDNSIHTANVVPKGVTLSGISDTTWKTVGEWACPAPPFDSGHVPYCNVAFSLYGTNQQAGCARLQFQSHSGAGWTTVSQSVYDIRYYGETKVLVGVASRVFVQSKFRLQIAGFDGFAPKTGYRNGIVMGIR
jgi:hypothetical protein